MYEYYQAEKPVRNIINLILHSFFRRALSLSHYFLFVDIMLPLCGFEMYTFILGNIHVMCHARLFIFFCFFLGL